MALIALSCQESCESAPCAMHKGSNLSIQWEQQLVEWTFEEFCREFLAALLRNCSTFFWRDYGMRREQCIQNQTYESSWRDRSQIARGRVRSAKTLSCQSFLQLESFVGSTMF